MMALEKHLNHVIPPEDCRVALQCMSKLLWDGSRGIVWGAVGSPGRVTRGDQGLPTDGDFFFLIVCFEQKGRRLMW